MSEDDIDRFVGQLVTYLETHPLVVVNGEVAEEAFDEIQQLAYSNFEGFCTKERNYN